MLKRLFVGLVAGSAALSATSLPVAAADGTFPVRWNTGAAVWSTHVDAFNTFFETGEVTDRALQGGLNLSGWTADEVRTGMTKTYSVDVVNVSRFLYSDAGVKFLKNATYLIRFRI